MAIALGVGFAGGNAAAQSPKPFPEFSAKRIKAPKSGSKPKISVQIDPVAQAAALSAPKAQASAAPQTAPSVVKKAGQFDWCWAKVSPDAAQSGPGRLEKAIATMAGASSKVPAPRLQ